jgi:hypothetical protein
MRSMAVTHVECQRNGTTDEHLILMQCKCQRCGAFKWRSLTFNHEQAMLIGEVSIALMLWRHIPSCDCDRVRCRIGGSVQRRKGILFRGVTP